MTDVCSPFFSLRVGGCPEDFRSDLCWKASDESGGGGGQAGRGPRLRECE